MTSQNKPPAADASTGWTDLDNEHPRRTRLDAPRVPPDRALQVMKLRREHTKRRLEALRVSGGGFVALVHAETVVPR